MKNNIQALVIISSVIILVFGKLKNTFYQQDEWYSLGLIFAEGVESVFSGISGPSDLLFIKGRLIANLVYYFFASSYPLENTQLAIFAIILHIVATFLVYILIRKFIKNDFFAILGALFFAVNAVSHSAVTWSAIAITAVGSTIFVLMGIFFFIKYLTESKKKWLICTGAMIYLSLWFKETGLHMFLFLPLATLLFKKYSLIPFVKTYWAFFLPFLMIVFFRVVELNLRQTTSNLYITGLNENFFSTIFLRGVLYPLTSFSLMFIPGDHFLNFAREVLREIYPFFSSAGNNILVAQTVILDLLSVILTFVILVTIYFLLQKEKKETKKIIYFWIIFSFMSFLPYIVLSKDFSYLEGRYYYLSVVGGAVLLSWFCKRLWEVFGPKMFYLIVLPLCISYLMFHVSVVQDSIAERVRLSNIQKDFMIQVKTLIPTLDNEKNVFYVTSDQDFWAEGNKLPFQQGSGYTLMILYYNTGKIPKEFLKAQSLLEVGFLYDIGSQGYKESRGLGFGYFFDKEELDKNVKLYNLLEDSIIRLKYDSDTNKLEME